jgi:hypothetical protein
MRAKGRTHGFEPPAFATRSTFRRYIRQKVERIASSGPVFATHGPERHALTPPAPPA